MKPEDLRLGVRYRVNGRTLVVLTNFYSSKQFVKYCPIRGGKKSKKGVIIRTSIFASIAKEERYEDSPDPDTLSQDPQ